MAGAWAPLQASHTMQGTPSSCCLLRSVNCTSSQETELGGSSPYPLGLPPPPPNEEQLSTAAPEARAKGRTRFFSAGGQGGPSELRKPAGLSPLLNWTWHDRGAVLFFIQREVCMLRYRGQEFQLITPNTSFGWGRQGEGGTQMIRVMKVCVFSLPSGEKVSCVIF